jgi:RsiW-degrading membrane proteinase PrsW (M82 family)
MATPPPPTAATPPRRPDWGYQASLWQVRQPAFWLFAVILVVTTIFSILIQASFADLTPGGWLLSWALLALYAVPVIIVIFALDLYEREPLSLVIGAFLWGAFAATSMSIFANQGWGLALIDWFGFDFAGRWAAALTAPLTEEITKGVGVVLIYLIARREIDDLMDGFVYGAMVGLGFTIVEDVFYFVNVFGGDFLGVLQGFFVRVIASGLYGHVLYTGLFGMGVAFFVSRRHDTTLAKRLAVGALLITAATFAHFLWNSPLLEFFPRGDLDTVGEYVQVVLATAVKGLPFLAVLALMLVLARRREHRWLRAALATEVGKEGLHADELAVLGSPSARRRARRELAARAGPQAARVLRRLHKAQIDLAMVVTRVGSEDHPDVVRQRRYCKELRDWLTAAVPQTPLAPPAGSPS